MSDVLIFDDDPAVADLLSGLLHARGLSVDAYTSGAGVVQTALDSRPKLLILDVMMPGMDGLTACRMIRANAAASRAKILILTAKRFAEDRAAAQRYGADAFLAKPFQVSELERTIEKLLGLPVAPEAPAPKAPDLRASFLGGAAVLKADSLWIFCDAGAGLARFVAAQSAFPPECWLLLSRYEPAALADLESLSAVPAKGSRLKIMGPDDPEGTLQRLAPRLTRPLGGRATPLLYPQREGEFILAPGVQGKALYTQHPGPTLAYRVNFGGLGAVWCPAHEISSEAAAWRGHEMNKFRDFFGGAGLLFHGYRRSVLGPAPAGGGRGAWEPAADLALESKVRRLALFALDGAKPTTQELSPILAPRVAARGGTMQAQACGGGEEFFLYF